MALQLLEFVHDEDPEEVVLHEPHHDLESFIYVLIYAIYRHESEALQESAEWARWKKVDAEMQAVFGHTSLDKIIRSRDAALRVIRQIPAGPLYKCVRALMAAVTQQNPAYIEDPRQFLTYEFVLVTLDEAITATLELEEPVVALSA